MAELLIRPGHNDHVAIANLLIPEARATLASVRRSISRLVVDAHLALAYPQYREAAAEAGTPLIIDPGTDLLQVDTYPWVSWRKLPYASDAARGGADRQPIRPRRAGGGNGRFRAHRPARPALRRGG